MYIVKVIKTGTTQSYATKEKAKEVARKLMSTFGLSVSITEDRPEEGKQYSLTGGHGQPCIFNGNTWAESEVK